MTKMNKKEGTKLTWVKEHIFEIITLFFFIGNLWMTSQLAPLLVKVGVIETRIAYLEVQAKDVVSKNEVDAKIDGLKTAITNNKTQLERIERKLDDLIVDLR